MKLLFALFSLLFLLTVALSVSDAQQRTRMTPEQRAARLKDSLALSDDQVGKIVTIFQESDSLRQQAFASAGDDRDARMAAMRKVTDDADSKIESLLTDRQKTKYEELKKQRMQGFQRRPQGN